MRRGPAVAQSLLTVNRRRQALGNQPSLCAIWEPIGAFRQALASSASQAGYEVSHLRELSDTCQEKPDLVVTYVDVRLLALCFEIITSGPRLIAVIDTYSGISLQTLVAIGVSAVIDRCAPEHDLQLVFCAMNQGLLVTPRPPSDRPDIASAILRIGTDERTWLQAAASGATVAEIAERSGHSERTLQRQLRRLYADLGVRNLTQALVAAASFGLIGPYS